ncbi:toprim domain-containing protein [Fluviispira multicolorata]|uniref:Toprim domain-containing protein n=1 Tax=Fluviispira multicolorata TaxID=2654512 RepID=A0A833JBM1_9BACT|nr:toprim domain-containing protein [Fluviispira multicolorata]KAB8029678.1 toprim domain-containing protein [Fluviispira multicolorata]
MRLRKQSIQNIIDSINLQEHLKRYIEVKRSGSHAVAKCPFHQESTPSFYIYPTNYHCFSCKAHGTVVDYEMHRTGASFREAMENLSEMYQIPLEFESPTERDQKNQLSSAFFDKQNKNLNDMEGFFKENLAKLIQKLDEEKTDLFSFINNGLKGFLDFSYTGSESEFQNFFSRSQISIQTNLDLSERFAFPVYKDNGKITGFLFSNKIQVFINNSSQNYIDLFEDLETYTPFPKSFLPILNWNTARIHATKAKELFVVSSIPDFLTLVKKGILNVTICLQEKLDINLAKIFSKRVPIVTLILDDSQFGNSFLWKTFVDNIHIDDLLFQVLRFPKKPDSLERFLTKFDTNGVLNWLANSKQIIDEVTVKTMKDLPASQKMEEFKKKVLPVLNKIENYARKDRLLDYLCKEHFGSAKDILYQATSSLHIEYTQKKNSNSIKIDEKKGSSYLLKASHQSDIKDISDIHGDKDFLNKTILFYNRILISEIGKEARFYLQERGISNEQMISWNLGFSPGSNELSRKVELKRIEAEKPLKLGLIKNSKNIGKYFDLFHDRIIIPIYGNDGSPVALAGRLFVKSQFKQAKEMPKYINSPESDLFAKSQILFHFHGALKSIISYGYVIVVEGYMDCISLVNAGISNTVAVMGTALTQAHMEVLTKVTKRIVICFDSDKAGQNAAKRSFSVAFPFSGVDLEYMLLPEGKDPDEFIRKFGVERFHKLTNQCVPLIHKICDWLYEESNAQPERFLSLIKEHMLTLVIAHPNVQTQNEVLSFLCERYFSNMTVVGLRKEMESSSFFSSRPLFVKEASAPQSGLLADWPVLNVHEVKLLFTLLHSKFFELPERLKNVAQGQSSEEEWDEKICALALNHQMSSESFSVFLEFISIMIENPYVSLLDLESIEKDGLSSHAKLLIAYVTSEAHILLQYHKEELLKESLPVNASMISLKNIWDLKNSGFLRFQLRNVKLSSQRGGLTSFVAETLLHLELEYIDNALRAFSSFHFDDEIDKQFQDLVRERTRRRTKFSNFESFSLQ